MSALSGTRLPEPTNWQVFEQHTRVLFRCVLKDPNTQLHGRQGQPQHGVDVYGYRDGDTSQLVGVQCKQKFDAAVSADELREEVRKALNFTPSITEFFLITTAKRDQAIQAVAREITAERAATDRPIKVYVWGWQDVTENAAEHDEAWQAFDPTFEPFSKRGFAEVKTQIAGVEERLTQTLSQLAERLPAAGSILNVEKSNRDDTEIFGRLKALDDIASSGSAQIALEQLIQLKENKWKDASAPERYRMHASIGSAYHQLGNDEKAAQHLLAAADAHPEHERADLARAKANFVLEDFETAKVLAEGLLEREGVAAEAAGIAVQCRYFTGAAEPLEGLPEALKDSTHVRLAQIVGERGRDNDAWRRLAAEAYAAHPDDDYLEWFAADALLEDVLSRHPDLHTTAQLSSDDLDLLSRAAALYRKLLEKPHRKEFLAPALANNAALAFRLNGDQEASASCLARGLHSAPDDVHMTLQQAAILRDGHDYAGAMALLPEDFPSVEGQILRAECLAAAGDAPGALSTLEKVDMTGIKGWLLLSALAVKARSLIDTNQSAAAKELVDGVASRHPGEAVYLALRLKVAFAIEGEEAAGRLLDAEISKIEAGGDFAGLLELCYEARRLDRDDVVVGLLSGRVNLERYSEALMMLLGASIDGNFTRGAQEIFDALPEAVRAHPAILRARAVFSIRVGDPDAEAHVSAALAASPNDLHMLLAKIGMLERAGERDALRALIAGIEPEQFSGSPDVRMALAQAMARNGRAEEGLARAYALLMDHWDNALVHLRYHGAILMNDEIGPALPFLDAVTDKCVVFLKNDRGEERAYRLEEKAPKAFGAEHLEASSDLAKALAGKKKGETIYLPKGIREEEWRIVEIKHPALDALHRSMEEFNRRFPRSQGLMRFEFDPNAEDPFEEMRAVLKASTERDENVLDVYREKIIPFLFVSSLIGRDPIEAWMGLLGSGRTFRISIGRAEERNAAATILASREPTGCVVDPITLAMILRLGLKEAVEHTCGQLHTTQSVLDVFSEREAELSGDLSKRGGSIAYRDGDLVRTDHTQEELQSALKARKEENAWVRAHCTLIPAIPAQDLPQEQKSLVARAGSYAWEPVIAAQGGDLLLLSEDLGLRVWAAGTLDVKACWLQPVLQKARKDGIIDQTKYSEATTSMAVAGHGYVSLSADDIFYQLEKDEFRVSDNVVRLIEATTGVNADIQTNMGVLGQLLGLAIESELEELTVCRLLSAILNAWSKGRGEHLPALTHEQLQRVPDCPKWLRQSGLSWLIGHSMGTPLFHELLNVQKQLRR